MWLFVIAGAAVVDAFATGMWLGKKWGNSSALATVGSDLAAVEAKVAPMVSVVEADVSKVVSALEADVAALRAKVSPAPVVTTGSVPAPTTLVQATLAAQAATAPK